ncbi:MAG: NAD(P)H-hydrate dehydratase [Eubacteriaceae bacterium]
MNVVTSEEMKYLDAVTIETTKISAIQLMERAGKKIYESILSEKKPNVLSDKFVIVAGTGNNGGDGLVVAQYLHNNKFNVEIVIIGDETKFTNETKYNRDMIINMGMKINYLGENFTIKQFDKLINEASIIIDGIFGIGLNRNIKNLYFESINVINSSNSYVCSIDIPSGIRGDNGNIAGVCVKSDYTVVIQNLKIGNILNDAQDYHGKYEIVDIGIKDDIVIQNKHLLEEKNIINMFKKRRKNTHKYHYGSVLVMGGSEGMTGAPLMSAYSALRTGSGLSTIGINEKYINQIYNVYPELMVKSYNHINNLTEIIKKKHAIAFGPGLGRKDYNHNILEYLIETEIPLVIDADGIYYLKYLMNEIRNREKIIITPHYGELAMLLEVNINYIKDDPIKYTSQLSKEYGITVVLKGNCTMISHKDEIFFNTLGNPGMATAGSGDVLTGIITSLIGQGFEIKKACVGGVYLHSLAGNIAAAKKGEYSMIATDIIECLPYAFKQLNIG